MHKQYFLHFNHFESMREVLFLLRKVTFTWKNWKYQNGAIHLNTLFKLFKFSHYIMMDWCFGREFILVQTPHSSSGFYSWLAMISHILACIGKLSLLVKCDRFVSHVARTKGCFLNSVKLLLSHFCFFHLTFASVTRFVGMSTLSIPLTE